MPGLARSQSGHSLRGGTIAVAGVDGDADAVDVLRVDAHGHRSRRGEVADVVRRGTAADRPGGRADRRRRDDERAPARVRAPAPPAVSKVADIRTAGSNCPGVSASTLATTTSPSRGSAARRISGPTVGRRAGRRAVAEGVARRDRHRERAAVGAQRTRRSAQADAERRGRARRRRRAADTRGRPVHEVPGERRAVVVRCGPGQASTVSPSARVRAHADGQPARGARGPGDGDRRRRLWTSTRAGALDRLDDELHALARAAARAARRWSRRRGQSSSSHPRGPTRYESAARRSSRSTRPSPTRRGGRWRSRPSAAASAPGTRPASTAGGLRRTRTLRRRSRPRP